VKGGANMLLLTHDVTLIREMYTEKFAALRGGDVARINSAADFEVVSRRQFCDRC
jgi:hypothetical protein